MEGFKIENKKQNNLEIKKIIDKASSRMALALKILIISGISLLSSNKTLAQNSENPSSGIENKSKPNIEWLANVSNSEKKDLEKEILSEHIWLVDYINSPKFTERSTKEQMRMEEIGVYGKSEADYQNFLNSPAFNLFKTNEKGDTIMAVNHVLKNIEFKNYNKKEMSDKDFQKIMDEGKFLDTFMPNPDVSKASPSIKAKVRWLKESRLERLEEGKIIVLDSILDNEGEKAAGFFNGDDMSIKITKDLTSDFNGATLVHEDTHKSTMMNSGINSVTFLLFKNRAEVTNKEIKDDNFIENQLKNPAEIIAKINQLRFLLKNENIYNASLEDFNESHFIKTLKNKKIMNNFAIRQLLDTLTKSDVIWFMNNVADTNIASVDIVNTA